MTDAPFLAEIRIMSFQNPVQRGWAHCNGQLLPINQNQALFSLLGTRFGGNGQTTFALPDLRGRLALHQGAGHIAGEAGGQEVHTLTQSEMPAHVHLLNASTQDGNTPVPTGNVLARSVNNIYGGVNNLATLAANTVTNVGGSQPHENRMPYLTLVFAISLQGIFPSRN